MDPATDDALHEALFNYCENRTLLVITHRLENIKRYDRIVVMEKGEIVELGHYNELVNNKDGFFNRLIE
jgi:ABC-type multidrug transport system fused ATPase/permease subunit